MQALAKLAFSATVALQALSNPGAAQDVKVGFALPSTGHYAFLGVQSRKGVDLALEELKKNEPNAKPKIEFLIQDQTADKTKAIALMTQFAARDKVSLILGPIGTAEALAAAPVVNELQVPAYMTAVSTDVLKAGPWSFKMWQDPKIVMDSVSDYIVKTGVKNIAIVFMRDGDSYIIFKNLVSERLKAGGVKVLAEEPLVSSDTDFSALGTKLVNMNPEAIFLGGLPEISANIVIQARRLGLSDNVKLFGIETLSTPTFAKIGGVDVEGTIIPTGYFPGTPSETNIKFVAAFREKYNEDPDLFAALGYQYILIASSAIRSAGATPTRESIRAALANIKDLPGVLGAGKYTLDGNREPSYGVTLVQYKGGKLVPVAN